MEHAVSPRSRLFEENSTDCQVPVYCYETPPQEPRYLVEDDKAPSNIVDAQNNYWEPVTTAQVFI